MNPSYLKTFYAIFLVVGALLPIACEGIEPAVNETPSEISGQFPTLESVSPTQTLPPPVIVTQPAKNLNLQLETIDQSTDKVDNKSTCDSTKEISVSYPEGWHGPNTAVGLNGMVITNYSELDVLEGKIAKEDQVKIQIRVEDIPAGSFESWINENINTNVNAEPLQNGVPRPYTKPVPYQLGTLNGVSYTVEGFKTFKILLLSVRDNSALIVAVSPALSADTAPVGQILETLHVENCSTP